MRRIFWTWAILAIAALTPALVLAGEREDKATAEQIATYLRDSGKMQKYSVGVKYRNGTVWLSGKVSSQQQMKTALDVISDIEGIEQIVNNMTVSSSSNVKQASAIRPTARRASATSPDMSIDSGDIGQMDGSGEATPAGYHRLAAKHAARHGHPLPCYNPATAAAPPAAYDQPHMPNYAWPSYAASPNYAAVTYPKQYSASAFPFIGPFHPYPQVPLGWRKVSLEWDDGWWFLDFQDRGHQ